MAKRIIVALLYLPIFIIVLFFLPPWCSVVFASLLSAIAAWEVLHNTGLVKAPFPLTLSILSALTLPAAICFGIRFPLILFYYLAVLAALGKGNKTADELVELTQLPARRVLSTLTMLQIGAAVEELPGKRFSALVELEE